MAVDDEPTHEEPTHESAHGPAARAPDATAGTAAAAVPAVGAGDAGRLRLSDPFMPTFLRLLINVLTVTVINYTLWFAITFYVYLQTRSVFATGVISGLFLVATVLTGIWFGSIVDHHGKKRVMQASAAISLGCYTGALALYLDSEPDDFTDPTSVRLWTLVVLVMLGVIVGNLRNIALPTVVTAIVPAAQRDRANGLVGTTSGVAFLVTSVISGLLVGSSGMLGALLLAVAILVVALIHLQLVRIPDDLVGGLEVAAADGEPKTVDLRGTIAVVGAIPGMFALIAFSALNNVLGGAFMALLDAYGLSMMSVQWWGLTFGGVSLVMIAAGLLIARTGLSSNPVRLILLVNLALWSTTIIFPLQPSVVWLVSGLVVYMMLVPYAEAAEQTVLQRVVPYERQGRVFGFAQSVEQAASPLTAFLLSPLTQFVVIPFMTDGAGARWIGGWFGTGDARGIALVFVCCGILGVALTAFALGSPFYRRLSGRYAQAVAEDVGGSD